jgi:putative FmdB family regulatory protein
VPTYSYRCTVCTHAFDVHQGFHDEPMTVCPECDGRLRKVFSPVGVVFKGSGFYRTDARSSTSTASTTSTTSSSTATSTASETTTQSSAPATTSAASPTPAPAAASTS